jgi:hypothetical protein
MAIFSNEVIKKYEQMSFDSKIDYFNSYLLFIQNTIKEKTPEKPPPGAEWYVESMYEDSLYDIYEFEQVLFRSFIVTLFAHLEYLLQIFCKQQEKNTSQRVKPKHLKGKGFVSYIEYIRLVLELDFLEESQFKNKLTRFRFIRNACVHSDGKVTNDKSLKFLKDSKPYTRINQNNYLIIEEDNLSDLIDLSKEISKKVFKEWKI